MPLIEYVTKRFNTSSMEIIEYANKIIDAYAEQNLTLTLRQLYYRFVAADKLPNTTQSYSRLGSIINDARLAGLVDWDAIEDRGRELNGVTHWDSPTEIIEAAARGFRIDKWIDQDKRVEVWVEKQALESIIERAAAALDCASFACKGYTSQSAMWRASQRFMEYEDAGQSIVVIHLGDHDPSGIDMTRDIFDRLNTTFRTEVEIERIALNMDQVRKYNPPPNPAKMTDSRATDYVRRFGSKSWELDALEPATLHTLIQDAIKRHLDVDKYNDKLAEEKAHRETMQTVADKWEAIETLVRKGEV